MRGDFFSRRKSLEGNIFFTGNSWYIRGNTFKVVLCYLRVCQLNHIHEHLFLEGKVTQIKNQGSDQILCSTLEKKQRIIKQLWKEKEQFATVDTGRVLHHGQRMFISGLVCVWFIVPFPNFLSDSMGRTRIVDSYLHKVQICFMESWMFQWLAGMLKLKSIKTAWGAC